jgi:hypothetical protein
VLGLGERRRDHGHFLGLRGVGSRDRLVGAGAGVGLSSPRFLALEVEAGNRTRARFQSKAGQSPLTKQASQSLAAHPRCDRVP